MDSLISQVNALQLERKGAIHYDESDGTPAKKASKSGRLENGAEVETSIDIPKGSEMISNGRTLTFTYKGRTCFSIPCYRNNFNNACGFVHSSKSIPYKSITSGYKLVTSLSTHQLNNTDGESVWNMCSDMDYPLARCEEKDHNYDGQFLASHVEMRALDYIYTHDMKITVHDEWSPNETRAGEITIYVDRPPCFNCLIFAYYFETKTRMDIKLFHDGKDYLESHKGEIESMIYELLHRPSYLYAAKFADLEEYYYRHDTYQLYFNRSKALHNAHGEALFGYTDEKYTEWIEKFSSLRIERDLGKTHLRMRELTLPVPRSPPKPRRIYVRRSRLPKCFD